MFIPPIINQINLQYERNFIPLGLLAIAAKIDKKKFNVTIYQSKKKLTGKNDYLELASDISKTQPHLVGFSTWCISYPSSLLVAEQIKIKSPKTTIVFGGPQASILQEETLKEFNFIDYIIAGESDHSFPLFIEEINKIQPNLSSVAGLSYRNKSGKIISIPLEKKQPRLNDLPIPAYDMVPIGKSLKIDVGRGCPYKCSFCTTNSFFSKKHRLKSAERILFEMNFAHQKWKINKFSFSHDIFTLNKKFIHEFCKLLIENQTTSGKKYTWTCSARIDSVDDEMLSIMNEAGCESIFFGIESASVNIQKTINKNLDISKTYKIANVCRHLGINMYASFIIGFPEETNADVEATLNCIAKLCLNGVFVQISELSLLPGTPIFEKHKNHLRIDGDFSNFSNTFCSKTELNLIKKYPLIFSSFYYLPVKTLHHREMAVLCRHINNLHFFRNTLFLLNDYFGNQLHTVSLLQNFKSFYHDITNQKEGKPVVFAIINSIHDLIKRHKLYVKNESLIDIFAFESYKAILIVKFKRWILIRNTPSKKTKNDNVSKIKPTPVWRILTTSFDLNKVLPEKNRWQSANGDKSKGSYKYLLIADSVKNCKTIKISDYDECLLNNLSEVSYRTFDTLATEISPTIKTKEWLQKMKKLGIVELE